MRPLRLTVKGFTAFRDEQVLDLSDAGLFAIWGPTGSGKSSLLDAMTYALFGQVERIGSQVGQLISQGQARMTVVFEFIVGDDRYRVTRSTPRNGGTKIIFEIATGDDQDDWEPAGEGSDRVRDVNRKITRLLGLDYDAFTRSVLLPQGKFAEFLVGEARERRDILTELLGLELFTRMARRAGEIAKDARNKAETMASLLEREYAGVTDEALSDAKRAADDATAREEALTKASERVTDVETRWRSARAAADELRACALQATQIATAIAEALHELKRHERSLAEAQAEREVAAAAHAAAAKAASDATAARTKAESGWGRATDLAAAREKAAVIPRLKADLDATQTTVEQVRGRDADLLAIMAQRDEAIAAARSLVGDKTQALEQARAAYLEATQRDKAAALCAGLHAGDPCPVCGTALVTVPVKAAAAKKLKELAEQGKRLEAEARAAEQAVAAAERARDSAERDLAENRKEAARLEQQVAHQRKALSEAEGNLALIFGGPVPDDPVATLDARIDELASMATAEQDALNAERTASTALAAAGTRHAEATAAAGVARARIEAQPLGALAERASRALPSHATELPQMDGTPAAAEQVVIDLTSLASTLDDAAGERESGERGLLAEATEAVEGLLPPQPSVEALIAALSAATRQATGDVARARQSVDTLTERLATLREMKTEVDELDIRASRFKVLAQELRADRLIAFLQGEALQLLCDAGSVHLGRLTDGRYRIVCEQDEFKVVDTWNGEEMRSVKTLSGGETFMASLSLALALSEQVQSLSVVEKARLESLFLDEGFGTLDAESLQEVIEAIEQLGGDGRIVGVITHIAELADQLPMKVIVEKSQRGSSLSIA